MVNRRDFLVAAGAVAAAAPLSAAAALAAEPAAPERDLYELVQYHLANEQQKQGLDAYLRDAAIPALNRLGIEPVGVFSGVKETSPVYVLLRHRSPASLIGLAQKLLADSEYLARGAAFLNAPADQPAFSRMESSLLWAFAGMPRLEIPVRNAGRVFQLRIYESPSVKTGQKKIEMFNEAGEIAIFRKVGLNPVFFGECLVGARMPNLTYMLAFESEEQQRANWKRFGGDPDWQKLRAIPEYADKLILSGITSIDLRPTEYSQI